MTPNSVGSVPAMPPRRTWRSVVGDAFLVLVVLVLLAYAAGTVWVSVRGKPPDGSRIVVAVPSALVSAAVAFVPDRDLREASEQARPWLPAVEAASLELARMPDATLVTVEGTGEHVKIAKRGGSIVIDVDDAGDVAHVAVPLRLVHSIARRLQSMPLADGSANGAETAGARQPI